MDTPPIPAPGRLSAAAGAPGRRPLWRRKRTLVAALPVGFLSFLLTIAPPLPERRDGGLPLLTRADGQPFRYLPNQQTYALDFDPRAVGLDLFEGWDREQEAAADGGALAFVSGPMYERHLDERGREITVPLGDLKFDGRIWRGRNRAAARQRAFVGIRHDGSVAFGYGELTPQREREFESFIGGLHSLYNDLQPPPADYRGAYSLSMGQQIRYFLPRIRMVIGLRGDGRVEVLMSRDGLTLEQTRALARRRGLQAAYLPDHASKSRFIIPGAKGFSMDDANWISGGATSFVHVPYLVRLSPRAIPLRGSLLASFGATTAAEGCGNPLQCGQTLGGQLLDRTLAGFNRLMEQGVEPLARLIWAPRGLRPPGRVAARAPLREPLISADPLVLQQRQQEEHQGEAPPLNGVEQESLGLVDQEQPLMAPEAEGQAPLEPAQATGGDPVPVEAQAPGPPTVLVGAPAAGAPAAPMLPPPP